jgi:CheY-like chemotaxis protein
MSFTSEPVVNATNQSIETNPPKHTGHLDATSGSKTVLVVEDNTPLLEVTCKLLEISGYRVIAASSGDEAIQLAMNYIGRIDVLLTDIRMPRMNGFELSLKLRNERPGMKVVFVSGSGEDLFDGDVPIEMADNQAFLQKPFTRQTLATKISEICDSQSLDPLAANTELPAV